MKKLPKRFQKIRITLGGRTWIDEPFRVFPDGRVMIDHYGPKIIGPNQYEVVESKNKEP